jgi:hypothetical protein
LRTRAHESGAVVERVPRLTRRPAAACRVHEASPLPLLGANPLAKLLTCAQPHGSAGEGCLARA